MKAWIFIVAVLVIGCGGPMMFAKDGAGQSDLQNDSYDCRTQWDMSSGAHAYRADPLGHMNVLSESRDFMKACMMRKGWTLTN